MWENVLLTGSYGRSLLKLALDSRDIKLAVPKNAYERKQVEGIAENIKRSRLGCDPLFFALLFDSVYLDSNLIHGGYIFTNDKDVNDVEAIPVVKEISENLSSILRNTNPLFAAFNRNGDGANTHEVNISSSEKQRVEMYRLLEPYVWDRMQTLGSKKINRKVMNEILNTLQDTPNILSEVRCRDLTSELDYFYFEKIFNEFWSLFEKSEESIRYFHQMIRLIDTKGSVAIATVQEAWRLDAALPIKNITNGRYGSQSIDDLKGQNGDFLVSLRMVLNEFRAFPVLNDISDVMRLKEDNGFNEFKQFINQWVRAISSHDRVTEKLLRREIDRANRALSKAYLCKKIGGMTTYVGVSILAVESFLDIPISDALGGPIAIGAASLQGYTDKVISDERWLMIGHEG